MKEFDTNKIRIFADSQQRIREMKENIPRINPGFYADWEQKNPEGVEKIRNIQKRILYVGSLFEAIVQCGGSYNTHKLPRQGNSHTLSGPDFFSIQVLIPGEELESIWNVAKIKSAGDEYFLDCDAHWLCVRKS